MSVSLTTVRRLDRRTRAAIARVYLAVYGDATLPESVADAERFAGTTLPRHARRAGFRLLLAEVDGEVVGFAYGFTGERGQYWSDWLVATVPADVAEGWVGGHFELVDLAVAPSHRGEGIGAALHDALLSGVPHERALLATTTRGNVAAALYVARGWEVLVDRLDGTKSLLGRDLRAGRGADTPAA